MKQRRSKSAEFVVGAIFTTAALLFTVASTASASEEWSVTRTVQTIRTPVTDLAVDVADPVDGSFAAVRIVTRKAGDKEVTRARLRLRHVNAKPGTVLGVHVHTGPCVEGDGAIAGPHSNITTVRGEERVVNPETEIWLDSRIGHDGRSESQSIVDFVLPFDQAQSIVIHERATDVTGDAGARLGCISL